MSGISWIFFVLDNAKNINTTTHIAGSRSTLSLTSMLIMIPTNYFLFIEHDLANAINAAIVGHITIIIAAILTYKEIKRSSN